MPGIEVVVDESPLEIVVQGSELELAVVNDADDIELVALTDTTEVLSLTEATEVVVVEGFASVGIASDTVGRIEMGPADEPEWRNATTLWVDTS